MYMQGEREHKSLWGGMLTWTVLVGETIGEDLPLEHALLWVGCSACDGEGPPIGGGHYLIMSKSDNPGPWRNHRAGTPTWYIFTYHRPK